MLCKKILIFSFLFTFCVAFLNSFAEDSITETTTLSDLPLRMRYSDAEWINLKENFKAWQPESYSKKDSEPLTCSDCGIFFYGVSLLPPYYITRTDDNLLINGYQLYPQRKSPSRTSEKYKKNIPTLPNEKHREARKEEIKRVWFTFFKFVDESEEMKDNEAREKWIIKRLKEEEIETKSLSISEKSIHFTYSTDIRKEGKIVKYFSPLRQKPIDPKPDHHTIEMDKLEDTIRVSLADDKIHFISPSGSWLSFHKKHIPEIVDLLESKKDERIVLFRLQKIVNQGHSIYIMANKMAFIEMLKNIVYE